MGAKKSSRNTNLRFAGFIRSYSRYEVIFIRSYLRLARKREVSWWFTGKLGAGDPSCGTAKGGREGGRW